MYLFRDFLIVGCGSFFGGGCRYLVSKVATAMCAASFPFGTFIVNLLGCFLIGFFSGLPYANFGLSPQAKLLLTTGFCGGFTTFSTFMNENLTLLNGSNYLYFFLYLVGSFALGLLFVWGGMAAAKFV